MSVFIDTSAIYSLLVRSEEGHAEVAEAFVGLVEGGRSLTTTNYVLVESAALLQHRFGLGPVRDLNARLMPLLRIIWISQETHVRAVNRHLKEDRRGLSLVDCTSFTVMDQEGIRDALALDVDFSSQGYKVVPAP